MKSGNLSCVKSLSLYFILAELFWYFQNQLCVVFYIIFEFMLIVAMFFGGQRVSVIVFFKQHFLHLFAEALLKMLKKNVKSSIPTIVFCNRSATCNFLGYLLEDCGVPHLRLNGTMSMTVCCLSTLTMSHIKRPMFKQPITTYYR